MTHPRDAAPQSDGRKRDPKGTRERLVRAALELFTSQGYHASTTPQIASRAGIAEGTIYRHFESKEQLLNEIYRAAVRMLERPISERQAGLSCRDRLSHVAIEWRHLARDNPPVIKLVFRADSGGALDSKSQSAFRSLVDGIERILADGKAAGEVRPGSARVWAEVWLQLIALVLERTADGEWPPEQAASQQVLESAWEAIGRR